MKKLLVGLLLLGLTACSGESVPWSNYSPDVKDRITNLVSSKDCLGLQKEFDVAYNNDNTQRTKFGEGNSKLLSYLDEQMKGIGCY